MGLLVCTFGIARPVSSFLTSRVRLVDPLVFGGKYRTNPPETTYRRNSRARQKRIKNWVILSTDVLASSSTLRPAASQPRARVLLLSHPFRPGTSRCLVPQTCQNPIHHEILCVTEACSRSYGICQALQQTINHRHSHLKIEYNTQAKSADVWPDLLKLVLAGVKETGANANIERIRRIWNLGHYENIVYMRFYNHMFLSHGNSCELGL